MREMSGIMLAHTLVGRDEPLGALQEAWRSGGTFVVRAAAGVGKSRLVRELASWAQTQGALVLTGRCSPTGRDTPLRPWREALLGAARAGRRPPTELGAFVPALARLVPEWGEPAEDPSALVLGEAIVRLLSSWTATDTTTLLLLEDLHWADPESLAVLEYLAHAVVDAPLFVVVTLRDGEGGPGTALAAELTDRRAAREVRLTPLSDDEVLAVARSCLDGHALPAEAGAALVARCDGVPFLVEELLATAVASGWQTITDDVPGSVASSVATRLDDLPSGSRSLLTAAALLGRQFDWTLAASAAGVSEDEATELLRLAVRAQLLDVHGARFRFRHALTQDAVIAAALPAEQARLADRLLDAMSEAAELDDELGPVAARLAALAGRTDRASDLWMRSARRALDQGSLASAERLAGHARDIGSRERAEEADEVLLHVSALSGQIERAGELGLRLLAARMDPTQRADVHLVLGAADLGAGRWDAAEEHATAARMLAASDPARLARGDALAAEAAVGRNDLDTAVALAHAALEGARRTDQVAVACEALEVIGRAERGRDVVAAEAAFTEAHDIAAAAGLRLWQVRALQELGTLDLFGSLSPDRLLEARRMAVALGALATVAVIDLQLGALYDERGDLAESLAASLRCEDASRRWRLSTLPMSLAVQAAAHARLGDREAMERACRAAIATGEDRDNVVEAVQGNTWPVFHIVQGDLVAAARAADQAMEVLRRGPDAAQPFPGLWALLRTLIDDDGVAARREVAELVVDTPVSRELLVAAEAVALGRAGDAVAAADRFTEADEAFGRRQGGFRRALVRMLVAPAALADGWGDPLAWLRETLATFEAKDLGALAHRTRAILREAGAPIPRRGRGDVTPVPAALAAMGITGREVDVLTLVATGATNREIGEQLFISVRTVDKHVERLLQKAGTTRAGLAEVARAGGLLPT